MLRIARFDDNVAHCARALLGLVDTLCVLLVTLAKLLLSPSLIINPTGSD